MRDFGTKAATLRLQQLLQCLGCMQATNQIATYTRYKLIKSKSQTVWPTEEKKNGYLYNLSWLPWLLTFSPKIKMLGGWPR